ncbi:MAG: hypothetical protein P1P90_02750 [Patescibacteria group bacterium]|nr:hypothetical protein [Patescibacteria group bacterium]
MKKTLLITTALICSLSLMGAGCDNSNPTEPNNTNTETESTDALNACNLLTKTIAADYLGTVDEPTLRDTAGVVSTCSYSNPDTFDAITLLVRRSQGDAEAATVNANAKAESKNLSGVDAEDVSGLGDGAYWAGGNLNQLNVFRGEDWLILTAFKDDFSKEKAIELMQRILQN